ncbi:translation initiation factor IF-2-like [Dromiciops gliroides]|uniref:translation initiation factor IF-2-like n=1 Tax=Dromiciops gliroides TaxID=33562 RepID=UPI001CC52946|nr:translation initiation factor IF-2-like [Dromiciops gliroides]
MSWAGVCASCCWRLAEVLLSAPARDEERAPLLPKMPTSENPSAVQGRPDAPCARDPYPDLIPSEVAGSEGPSAAPLGGAMASGGHQQVLGVASDPRPAAVLPADLEPGTEGGDLACPQASGAEQGLVKPEAHSTGFQEGSWAGAAGGLGPASEAPFTSSSQEAQGWGPTRGLEAKNQVLPRQGGWGAPESDSACSGGPCVSQEAYSRPQGPGPHEPLEQKREDVPPPPLPGQGGLGGAGYRGTRGLCPWVARGVQQPSEHGESHSLVPAMPTSDVCSG